jgi:hypothetical protein
MPSVGQVYTFNATGSGATGSYINWKVPIKGRYKIECVGARGGYQPEFNVGGKPARMIGEFTFSSNPILVMIVGQAGTNGNSDDGCGGGGGSFVTMTDNTSSYTMFDGTKVTPLIVAGGGGGDGADQGGFNASLTTSSTANGDGSRGATTALNGGLANDGAGAGGFSGNGASNGTASIGGTSFLNGAIGGQGYRAGGFGGGGSGSSSTEGAGGGGGYAGAPGGASGTDAGGGGGSYNTGINQTNSVATDITAHGYIKITILETYEYHLIKSNDKYYTYDSSYNSCKDINISTTYPTKTDFINNNITDWNMLLTTQYSTKKDFENARTVDTGKLYSFYINRSAIGGLKNIKYLSTIKNYGTYRAWADGTYAKSATEYLYPTDPKYAYQGDTGDGVYRIQPIAGGSTIDVYCSMDTSKDEGGWMLIINTGAKTSHTNLVTAIGSTPILPTQTTVAKLSDTDINNLRGGSSNYMNSIIRLDRPNNPTFCSNPMYFKQNIPWTSNGTTTSNMFYQYYTTYNGAKTSTGLSTNGLTYSSAISTWGTGSANYMIIMDYSSEGLISNNVYEGSRSERCAWVWIKRLS